jgi:hypothetical protein
MAALLCATNLDRHKAQAKHLGHRDAPTQFGKVDAGHGMELPWAVAEWSAGLDALTQPWGPLRVAPDREQVEQREQLRREALDAASRAHLKVVAGAMDLGSLWPAFTSDQWNETDVIFQVPGPLLTAPVAWLAFGPDNSPLFEKVASTSSVTSLTLRDHAERAARAPQHAALSIHWEEPARRKATGGMYRVQADMIEIGREHGWDVYCLGDAPTATATNLRRALRDAERRFGLVLVNAHGLQGRFGVRLAGPSDWRGDGSNLDDVDLLLLLACSVGRLRQDGTRDVEGLYAELAAHHGRTVIAARWPIADNETASLGSAIVREYLAEVAKLNGNGERLPVFARARALNRARRLAIASGAVSMHLAAAFEIFGLG